MSLFFFFFKQKTAYEMRISDWSSDVCSSDLAKGLLIASIEDNDPVVFFEPKRIYNGPFDGYYERPVTPWAKHPKAQVPEEHYTVPRGKAEIVREGEAVTILAYGTMVHVALATAEAARSDEHTSELQSLMRTRYAALC